MRSTPAVETRDVADGIQTNRHVVWLHGFTQTSHSWNVLLAQHELARRHARHWYVDLPGHGNSPPASGDLWKAADDIIEALDSTGFEQGVLVGYSLGGRTALHMALRQPSLWQGVVLIGTTAGIADDAERYARRLADEQRAEHLETVGLETFLDEWLAQSLFDRLVIHDDDLADRRRNTVRGLASSLRCCGTGTQQDLRARLTELTMPALVIAGSEDTKFVAAGADLSTRWGGEVTFTVVPEAGHAVHLEQPGPVSDVIGRWLDRLS